MKNNRLTCGPFTRGTEDTVLKELEGLGLRLSDGNSPVCCVTEHTGGFRLEIQGEGVRGYLLAEDGEEAELQDVKRLVLSCCQPGREVTFSGSTAITKETVLVVSSRASHDGKTVKWSSTRTVLGPGTVRVVRDNGG